MCYSGGNCLVSPFYSTYGTGPHKSINKCNFDLIEFLSMFILYTPIFRLKL